MWDERGDVWNVGNFVLGFVSVVRVIESFFGGILKYDNIVVFKIVEIEWWMIKVCYGDVGFVSSKY